MNGREEPGPLHSPARTVRDAEAVVLKQPAR